MFSARRSIEWNTGEYDTRSALEFSTGDGQWLFTLRGSRLVQSDKFPEAAKTQNLTRAA